MSTEQKGHSNMSTDADGTRKGTSLIDRRPIENTPFCVIEFEREESPEKWFFIVAGKYRVTDEFRTEEECWVDLEKNKWSVVMILAELVIEEMTKAEKEHLRKLIEKMPSTQEKQMLGADHNVVENEERLSKGLDGVNRAGWAEAKDREWEERGRKSQRPGDEKL